MAEVVGAVDYAQMARAVGKANKAQLILVDLATANLLPPKLLASNGSKIWIRDKGAGNFNLTTVFLDGSTLTLTQAQISNGDQFPWNFYQLYITNMAQPGNTVTLIVESSILSPVLPI